jgi:hypothetical protein
LNLPTKIRILHRDYELKKLPQDQQLSSPHQGEISFGRRQILYLDGPASEEVDTIVHECLHGLVHGFNLELDEEEEKIVCVLATGLTTLMKDNPTLFPALQGMLK